MDGFDQCKSRMLILKSEINSLLQSKDYSVDDVIKKIVLFNALITNNTASISHSEQAKPFLIASQEWLAITVEKIQLEQQSVANQIMQLQQRKKVERKYGVHQ
jgi:hypothetical protein